MDGGNSTTAVGGGAACCPRRVIRKAGEGRLTYKERRRSYDDVSEEVRAVHAVTQTTASSTEPPKVKAK